MAATTKSKIIKSAGKRGKTKAELAESVGIGYAQAAKVVNDLAYGTGPDAPQLFFKGKSKSGADVFTSSDPTADTSYSAK